MGGRDEESLGLGVRGRKLYRVVLVGMVEEVVCEGEVGECVVSGGAFEGGLIGSEVDGLDGESDGIEGGVVNGGDVDWGGHDGEVGDFVEEDGLGSDGVE